ncbi:MAG: hypothetical protein KKB30_12510 [Proteobacteria bacterium]|nr:hypothetical protein [Pseudomonadota bacterium]MBU1714664.1 hypothetical protein [Pseudomonadota bacterium]
MSKLKSHLLLIGFLLLLAPLLTGCFTMGYNRNYGGELRPLAEVAVIVQRNTTTASWIDYIDGVDLHTALNNGLGRLAITDLQELIPGKHTICAGFSSNSLSGRYSVGCLNLELDAKPGHVYFFYPRLYTHNSSWEPAYWDITGELHTPELKKLTDEIDQSLAKNRGGTPESILSLATKKSRSPLVGFGEEHKANLQQWLKKDVTVSYKFDRYVPYIVVKADDGMEYHLEIDQQTGLVANVFGKYVYPDHEKANTQAFQPADSKIAYEYNQNMKTLLESEWEEQKDGSYIKIKSRFNGRCGETIYYAYLKPQIKDQLGKEAINALALAINANVKTLGQRTDINYKRRINGKSPAEINRILELEVQAMGNEISRLVLIAANEAKTDREMDNLTKTVTLINDLLTKP